MKRCQGCTGIPEPALYCSKDCQVAHWPVHKQECPINKGNVKMSTCFEDPYRRARDGSCHMGKLELVTWEFGKLGWGGTYKEESDDLKAKFEGDGPCLSMDLLWYECGGGGTWVRSPRGLEQPHPVCL